jgi:hypothetical protein
VRAKRSPALSRDQNDLEGNDAPTVTLEGDANGAPHPEAAVYAKKFTGTYKHW